MNLTVGGTATGRHGRVDLRSWPRALAAASPDRLAQGNHVIRVEIDQGTGNPPKTAEQAVSLPAGITALALAPS